MTFDGRAPDPWHPLAPTAPYTGGTPEVRIDTTGTTHLACEVAVLRNAAATGDTVFVLPAEYRPTRLIRRLIPCSPSAAIGQAAIYPTGEVNLFVISGTPTAYFVDCSFSTY